MKAKEKAEKALEALREKVREDATALIEGERQGIVFTFIVRIFILFYLFYLFKL